MHEEVFSFLATQNAGDVKTLTAAAPCAHLG
jgi:hypothetical protein